MGGDSRIPPTPPGHVPDQSGSGSAGASKAQTDHVVVQCGTAEGARWDHFEWIWTKDLVGSEGEAEADGHVVNMGSGSCGCSQGRDSQVPGWSGSAPSKLGLAGWKRHLQAQHVPYRRDCKVCLETMGSAEPHRRKKGQESAFVMILSPRAPSWASPSAEK